MSRGRSRGRGREKTLRAEPYDNVGLDPMTLGSRLQPKSRVGHSTTEPLRHP